MKVWRFLAVPPALYCAFLGLLFVQQRSLLFPASQDAVSAVEAGLAQVEDVVVTTADGERLRAWWKPPEPGRAVILYFHGNAGALRARTGRVRTLSAEGRGLLLVAYRGYSGSTGSPSEAGLFRDADAALAFARTRAPGHPVALYGESLGSAVAVDLASREEVAGVVLDAPFTSAADVAKLTYWYVPVDRLMKDPFRSIDRIGRVTEPLLVLHGERDGLIPIAQGRRIHEAAGSSAKRFVALPEAGHVNVLERGGAREVMDFVARLERGRP